MVVPFNSITPAGAQVDLVFSTRELGYQLRPEIQWTRVRHGAEDVWIATDPWTRDFHRCTEEDYRILNWLADEESCDGIVSRFNRAFKPRRIDRSQIVSILEHAKALGLLKLKPSVITPSGADSSLLDESSGVPTNSAALRRGIERGAAVRRRSAFVVWCNFVVRLFQSKVSFGDPSHWVQSARPLARLIFGPGGFSLLTLLAIFALMVVTFRWETLSAEFPSWTDLRSPAIWVGYGVLFLVTRFMHEIGHAFACSCFSVRVRDFGMIGNFGMLCPYVDITESWRCERTHQRILIALGGIFAEVWLAALAAIVWGFTVSGPVHDIAYQLMLICSITTVLFNANPLIKYDGYYVLCDLLGMQNLRDRAWEAFDGLWEGRFPATVVQSLLLSAYYFMSLMNRSLILFGIITVFYMAATRWRIAGIAILLMMIYGLSLFVVCVARVRRRESESRERKNGLTYQIVGWGSVGAMAALSVTMPLPSRVTSEGIFSVGSSNILYAPETGRLSLAVPIANEDSALDWGAFSVAAGDPVLTIENSEIEKGLLSAEKQAAQVRHAMESKTRHAFYDSVHLEEIPILKAQLGQLEARIKEYRDRSANAKIKAASEGVFRLASASGMPKRYLSSPREQSTDSVRISQTLHEGEIVRKGDELGRIETGKGVTIECWLTEDEIAKIRTGATAKVRSRRFPRNVFVAEVEEIGHSIAGTAHPGSLQRDESGPIPRSQKICVRLRLAANETSREMRTCLDRSSADVRFFCKNRSLFDDLCDSVLRNFRLR